MEAQRAAVIRDVTRAFRNAGYPEARAGALTVDLAPDRGSIRVGVRVAAGPRARVGRIRVSESDPSAATRPPATPTEVDALEAGRWYAQDAVESAVAALERLYRNNGYPRAFVAPRTRLRGHRVDVELVVERGPRYRIVRVVRVARGAAADIAPESIGLRRGALFRLDEVEAATERLRDAWGAREAHWRVVPEAGPEAATLRIVL